MSRRNRERLKRRRELTNRLLGCSRRRLYGSRLLGSGNCGLLARSRFGESRLLRHRCSFGRSRLLGYCNLGRLSWRKQHVQKRFIEIRVECTNPRQR